MMTASIFRSTAALLLLAGMLATANIAAALSNPNDFCTGDPCQITANKTADADLTLDFGTRAVVLSSVLTVGKYPTNDVSSLTILAGSFSIIGTGQIDGNGGSRWGGSVTIDTTGDIRIDGTRTTGAIRVTGTDAGQIALYAGGNVYGAGRLNLSETSVLAGGGELVIAANGGINLSGAIFADGGVQGFGGTLDISANQNIALTGTIDLSGGQSGGGTLDIFGEAAVTLGPLDLQGSGEYGDGGFALVFAVGNLTINGGVVGHGASTTLSCGDASDLDLTSDSAIFVNAPIEMRGRGLDCSGGSLTIDGASVQIGALLDVSATGGEGIGGDIDLTSYSTMIIAAAVNTHGGDGGGDILISADGNISVGGNIRAEGRGTYGAGASLIDIDSGGTLAIAGNIDAHGGPMGSGGDITLSGCTVFQTGTSILDTRASAGAISVNGNDSITLQGTFFSEPTTTQAIVIRYRASGPPPNTAAATFNVAPTLIASPLILPCALCGSNAECNDNNPCTDDICVPATGCTNLPNTNPCNDGNACTTGDICALSACIGLTPVVCNDGNPCTDNTCDPLFGCQTTPNTAPCNDGDSCTENDTCAAGNCSGSPIDCSDGNPCTDNACVGGSCQSFNNNSACDDGDACTTTDSCSGGTCQPGPAAVCEDDDACTIDSCDPGIGCVNSEIPECTESDADGDGILDDDDVCTTLDWTTSPQSPPNQHASKMTLNIKGLTKPRGEQGILFKGAFNPAAPALPIAPDVNGIHFSIADADGVLYDVDIPGGVVGSPQNCGPRDGWKVFAGVKPRWKYGNKTGAVPPACLAGSARGVKVIQIKDLRSGGKAALQTKVSIKKAVVERVPSVPLNRIQANLVLATQPAPGQASAAAIAGQCAEGLIVGSPIASSSPVPFCKLKFRAANLEKLTCRGR